MSAGLQVTSQDGVVQVDTSFPNMGLVAKLSPDSTGTISFTAVNPIVFHTGSCHLLAVTKNGNSWQFKYNQISGSPTYYVFDDMGSAGATTGIGIESFDASGNRIFTTALPPMRVVSTLQLPSGGIAATGEHQEYTAGDGSSGVAIPQSAGPYAPSCQYSGLTNGPVYAGTMSIYRYGAIGSSTETNYGDPMYECLTVNSTGWYVYGANMGSGSEFFGGYLGSSYDKGYAPIVTIIDVTNY